MEVTYSLQPRDIANYQRAAWRRLQKRRTWKDELLSFLIVIAIAGSVWTATAWGLPRLTAEPVAVPELVLGVVLGALAMLAVLRERARSMLRRDGPTLSERRLALSDAGVEIRSATFESLYRWSVIEEVGEYGSLVVLWVEPGTGVVVPRGAFADPAAERTFLDAVRGHMGAAKRAGPG